VGENIMKKIKCLALNIDNTLIDPASPDKVNWFVDSQFWFAILNDLKTKIESNGDQFMLAIVTSRPSFDDVCASVQQALGSLMSTVVPADSQLPSGLCYQQNGAVYLSRVSENSDTNLGNVSEHLHSSFQLIGSDFTADVLNAPNVLVALLECIENHPLYESLPRYLPRDLARFIAMLQANKEALNTNRKNDYREKLLQCVEYIVGLEKSFALQDIKQRFNISEIIYWDSSFHVLKSVENFGVAAAVQHTRWAEQQQYWKCKLADLQCSSALSPLLERLLAESIKKCFHTLTKPLGLSKKRRVAVALSAGVRIFSDLNPRLKFVRKAGDAPLKKRVRLMDGLR
jgi:hypothetical protein